MPRKVYLVYSPCVDDQLQRLTEHALIKEKNIELRKVKLVDMPAIHIQEDLNHALLWIEQKEYSQVLILACQKKISLGFLPISGDTSNQFFKNLDLPKSFDNCLDIALYKDPLFIDLITCNDQIVTNGVTLENQTAMAEFMGDSRNFKGIDKIGFNLKRFVHAFSLKPHPVSLITAKGKTVTTAITGMVLLDFHKNGSLASIFRGSISLRDRRISVALFAPQSILSYLRLSSSALLATKKKKIPQQLGYIRTASLTINTPVDTHYMVNNAPLTTRELNIKTLSEGVRVNADEKFREKHRYTDDKENVSCNHLPKQAGRIKYLSNTLPFFPHALESDFKELFLSLKENASVSNSYILLMVLSSVLATLGLFLDSPSIVIGAMVLAPLMAPIISLSMGMLRSEPDLSRRSFLTLFTGMLIALILSALMAWALPFQEVSKEIEGRLHPSTLDLLVAVISGVAGAFASARENIAKSLPGVAIAVALVPPLCVSGIGLGWWKLEVFYGAMLLFLTNLTGIILAAGLSFMVIGFAPFSRARKGIMLSILMVTIISIPLFFSFSDMQKIAAVEKQLLNQTYEIEGQYLRLRNIKISLKNPMELSAELVTTRLPDPNDLVLFEQHLTKQLEQPVAVELSVRLVTEKHF